MPTLRGHHTTPAGSVDLKVEASRRHLGRIETTLLAQIQRGGSNPTTPHAQATLIDHALDRTFQLVPAPHAVTLRIDDIARHVGAGRAIVSISSGLRVRIQQQSLATVNGASVIATTAAEAARLASRLSTHMPSHVADTEAHGAGPWDAVADRAWHLALTTTTHIDSPQWRAAVEQEQP